LLDRAVIRSSGGFVSQGRYSGKQPATVADRGHADADQIVGRQLRQHFAIDIVVAECRRVLFEPQPAQPRHYVHAVILGSEERQPLMNRGYSSALRPASGSAEIPAVPGVAASGRE
jgi:hypothetical protein